MFQKERQETENERIIKEIAHLNKLFKNNSIDKGTYERYKTLLKMSNVKK